MELKVINEQGQAAEALTASDALFAREYNEALVHQVITAYLANARSGNRAQKGRAEISKSTRKPFRQKGTGRARAGRASSPLWRGGGKIFPNSPEENFEQKINRKMYRAAMATILSQLVREDRLTVIDALTVETPKTKQLNTKLQHIGFDRALIITEELSENLYLSARNLPHVLVLESTEIDPLSLVRSKQVLITRDAVKKIEEILA
jgi:large subunit ribosomal protein L4